VDVSSGGEVGVDEGTISAVGVALDAGSATGDGDGVRCGELAAVHALKMIITPQMVSHRFMLILPSTDLNPILTHFREARAADKWTFQPGVRILWRGESPIINGSVE
jgi:hypothetical protein